MVNLDLHEELARGGGMRMSVDTLLEQHCSQVEELRTRTADVLPAYADDIFLLRYVLTHSKRGTFNVISAGEALRQTIRWRAENAAVLEKTVATGKGPHDDIATKFNTIGYAGDLGGHEPVYVLRTGLCNLKGLMSTLTHDQVRVHVPFYALPLFPSATSHCTFVFPR